MKLLKIMAAIGLIGVSMQGWADEQEQINQQNTELQNRAIMENWDAGASYDSSSGNAQSQAAKRKAAWLAQDAAERLADHWGAIAVDITGVNLANYTNNYRSEDEAADTALSACQKRGGTDCRLVALFNNSCAALFVTGVKDPIVLSRTGDTMQEALDNTRAACQELPNSNCGQWSYLACSAYGYNKKNQYSMTPVDAFDWRYNE